MAMRLQLTFYGKTFNSTNMEKLNSEYQMAKRETIKYWNSNKDYLLTIALTALFIWASRNGFFN